MAARSNAPVIIIKKKRVVAADVHHGGAWKVAYADFVTAMMAFFLLMWLLNATTEQQRKGIADYFSPTIPINRVSGGGDGSFGGDDIFVEDRMAQTGDVPTIQSRGEAQSLALANGAVADAAEDADIEALRDVEDDLLGRSGEIVMSENAMRHVVTRQTDEGLVIEVFDRGDAMLFEPGTSTPTAVTRELAVIFARTFNLVGNPVVVEGHVRSLPLVLVDNPAWELSIERASRFRDMLERSGLDADRVARVTGHADRDQVTDNTFDIRNNRLEVILLRSDR
ncbi:OmpA/MotB family protein [Roseisalinus antarcticus]|uniref:Motility protein B n=1 Tax=Roseisalinus antarcticus TaxID=254357 RepID=A0A1Y5TN49_9RHOB|nr:flagellar motor protein MotB [Roseisalinus antarcticus]SLN66021.1 Motility protein B [Roseisalinus antarcticus]